MAALTVNGCCPPALVLIESASGLRNADTLTKSDPYCTLSNKVFCCSTRVISNNLNPVWDTAFLVCLPSSVSSDFTVQVFDRDSGSRLNDDFLGKTELNLLDLLESNPTGWSSITLPLEGDHAQGTITISVRYYVDVAITIHGCSGLRNADGRGDRSDPYCTLKGFKNINLGRTQTVQDELNPTFGSSFKVHLLDRFPLGSKLDPLTLTVMDEDTGSRDDFLGRVDIPWKTLWGDSVMREDVELPLSGKKATGSISFTVEASTQRGHLRPPAVQGSAAEPDTTHNAAESSESTPLEASTIVLESMSGEMQESETMAPDEAMPPITRISRAQNTATLVSGQGFKIADCCDDIPDQFTMGLAWEMNNGKAVDLDASCIVLNEQLETLEIVSFSHLKSITGAIQHQGDEREGDEEGDDEQIKIDLGKIPENYHSLTFVVNSFTQKENLNEVKDCRCRLFNSTTNIDLATFELTGNSDLNCTAFLMCVLYRVGTDWFMHAIGEGAHGKRAKESVGELTAFLERTKLGQGLPVSSSSSKIAYVRVVVPEDLGEDRRMEFTFPDGGGQQFIVPEGISLGAVLEVPIVQFFGSSQSGRRN